MSQTRFNFLLLSLTILGVLAICFGLAVLTAHLFTLAADLLSAATSAGG
jgi:hypothetical protein